MSETTSDLRKARRTTAPAQPTPTPSPGPTPPAPAPQNNRFLQTAGGDTESRWVQGEQIEREGAGTIEGGSLTDRVNFQISGQGAAETDFWSAETASINTLQQDIIAIAEQRDAGEIRDWQNTSERLVQLIETAEDPEMVEQLKGLVGLAIYNYGDEIMPHLRQTVGQEWIDENIPKHQDPEWWQELGGRALALVTPVLDWLDTAWQGTASGLAAARDNAGLGKQALEVSKGLGNFATFGQIDALAPDRELAEKYAGDDGRYNFEEAMGVDIDYGDWYGSGLAEGATSLAGEIALDPTTYLGGAGVVKKLSRTVIEEAAEHGLDDAAQAALRRMAESGTSVWTKQERDLVEEMLLRRELKVGERAAGKLIDEVGTVINPKKLAEQTANNNKARERIAKLTESRLATDAVDTAGSTTKKADKGLDKLDRMGQSGVRWFGYTVPGTPKLADLLRLNKGVFAPQTKVVEDLTELIEVTDDMIVDTSKIRTGVDDVIEVPELLELGPGAAAPKALGAADEPLGALGPGPAEGYGPQLLPTPANAEDMAKLLKEVDDYLVRLSPGQMEDAREILEAWDPLTEKLVFKTATQDATFDLMTHVGNRAGFPRAAADEVFEAGSDGVARPLKNRFGKIITDEVAPDINKSKAWEFFEETAPKVDVDTGIDVLKTTRGPIPTEDIATGLFTLSKIEKTRLGELLASSKILQGFGERFVPRFGLPNKFGKYASDAVRTAQVKAHRGTLARIAEMKARLDDTGLEARARARALEDGIDLDRITNEAMADPAVLALYREKLASTNPVRQVLEVLDDVRNQIFEIMPEDIKPFLPKDSYNPRVWSEDAKLRIKNAADADPKLGQRLSEAMGFDVTELENFTMHSAGDSFVNERTIAKGVQDVFDVNEEAHKILKMAGIEDVTDLYTTDLMAAWSVRAESALRARIKIDFGDGLSKIKGEDGRALFQWVDEFDGKLPIGMTRHEEVFGRPAFVDSALDEEVANFFRVVDNPDEFSKFFSAANEMWASMALLSPGFHARNAYGNIFNMFLGGMRNPVKWIKEASRYKQYEADIMRNIKETGNSFDDAAKAVGVHPNDVELLRASRDLHILSGGQMDDILDNTDPVPFYRPIKKTAHFSRDIGTKMESNARMAMFLQRVNRGDSYDEAANHVKKFLFDYDDLTRFERKLRTSVARFYTFTRKNTALQVEMLATYPGKVAALVDIQEELADQVAHFVLGEPGEGEGAMGWAPPWAQAALMTQRSGSFIGVDSPFTGGIEAIESLAALGTLPITIAGLDEELPEGVRNALFYGDLGDQFNRALAFTSGFGPAMVQFAAGEMAGASTFTGQPHEDMSTNAFFRGLSAANPFFARGYRLAEDLGWEGAEIFQNTEKIEQIRRDADRALIEAENAGRPTTGLKTGDEAVEEFLTKGEVDNKMSMILNWMMGLNYYDGEKANRQAQYTLNAALDEMYEELGGYNIPTISEMKEEGTLEITSSALQALAYADQSDEGQLEVVRKLLGKDLYEAFIGPEPTKDGKDIFAEDEREETKRRIDDKVIAWEYHFGRKIDAQSYAQIIQRSELALSSTELAELGLEDPTRSGNRFVEDDEEIRTTLAENADNLRFLAEAGGFDVDDLYGRKLSDIERALQEGAEVGMTWQEVVEWYVANEWNRTESGVILGDDALSLTTDGNRSLRDEQREQNTAWEFGIELDAVFMLTQGRLPTMEEKEYYTFLTQMNVGDQEYNIAMGAVPSGWNRRPSIPSAKNIQSEQEQADDAYDELQSQRRGLRDGMYVGRYEDTPDGEPNPGVPGAYNRFAGELGSTPPGRFERAYEG